jgi:hypothetical protein
LAFSGGKSPATKRSTSHSGTGFSLSIMIDVSALERRKSFVKSAQALSNARYGQTDLVRDLFEGQPVDVVEHRNDAGGCLGSAEERIERPAREGLRLGRFVFRRRDRMKECLVAVFGPASFGAQTIQAYVRGDSKQQRGRRWVAREVGSTQEFDEHVVHRVQGLSLVSK